MNITSPILAGTIRSAKFPGDSAAPLLNLTWPVTGWFDESLDGGLGVVMSGLAGVAAALLVAIVLSFYFRTGYRSTRDIVKHGLATALLVGLVAFAIYDLRHTALTYLGLTAATTTTVVPPHAGLIAIADRRIVP
ncbi:hypothetical protein [Bradyrhizobium sp. ORS 86]|uniref:hypothetical protein n=1 Tax=Bradyrhizobium sp. ORS 86 TaxID=1685970 RepID=UPI00388EBA57